MAHNKSTQIFVPIQDIRDGVVFLKNGSFRLVIMVSSINFALKSDDEQTGLLLQFQNFLNSLDFSLQLFVQSQRLDIEPYLKTLSGNIDSQDNELLKIQTREYTEFVRNFTESVNVMSKNFFVVIPYSAPAIQSKASFLNTLLGRKQGATLHEERFEEIKIQLEQRAVVIEQGLAAMGLRSARLRTEELVELFYKLYNPREKTKPVLTKELQGRGREH